MAYKLDKYGQQVKEDLDKVENKDIYPDASTRERGLMTQQHVQTLQYVEENVQKETETLSDFEIRMICR
jgi:hypothetical protein